MKSRFNLDHPSSSKPTRREFLVGMSRGVAALAGTVILAPLVATPLVARQLDAESAPKANAVMLMNVYKDPNCGCCKEWVKIMQKDGFQVTVHDTADMNAVKTSMGVPKNLQSCHTALVGQYVFEGHVPVDVIHKLLAEKPAARGLAVPGMPSGSPGMDGPTKDKYDVVLFERSGKTRVYASR